MARVDARIFAVEDPKTIKAHAEKIWTTNASGLWADGANWSGHSPPDITSFMRISNAITKTVTIDVATPASTLTVQKLTISAPPGATNILLLSTVGIANPLIFQTGLDILDGGIIRITNSALQTLLTNDHVNIDGDLILDSGLLDFGATTVTARVGRATSGTLTINGGYVNAGAVTVGGLGNSSGYVYLNGGTLDISSLLSVGRNVGTTGSVSVLGGLLNVTNDDTRIGDGGAGSMVLSNATATLNNLQVGRDGEGILTVQSGGILRIMLDTVIGRFSGVTGSVFISGGQMLVPGQKIYVGRGGGGQMKLTSGAVQAGNVLVAADTTNSVGSTGILTASGGSISISTNLLVGSFTYSTGQVVVAGGSIFVTNSAGSAALAVPSGTVTMSGGSITTDQMLLTNSAGQFIFNGGTLSTRATSVANGKAFVVGDGISPATLFLNGGTHAFAGGLVISSNATLSGCGTIVGSVLNHGTIATNCGGGVPPNITAVPQSQTVAQGGSFTFSVAATGPQPLTYQWQSRGTNIPGATTSAYTRTNAQQGDAGNYMVIVSDPAGSTNSPLAILRVLSPTTVTYQGIVATTSTFSFPSVSGLIYTLQYKNFLTNASWTDLLPSTNGTGGQIVLRDTSATSPSRFYRIRVQ